MFMLRIENKSWHEAVQEERRHIVSQRSNDVGSCLLRKHTTDTGIGEISTEEFQRVHVSVWQNALAKISLPRCRTTSVFSVEHAYISAQNLQQAGWLLTVS
jgi:hypothetical protein